MSPLQPTITSLPENSSLSTPTNIEPEIVSQAPSGNNSDTNHGFAPIIYPHTKMKYNYIVLNAWSIRLANLFGFIAYFGVLFGFSEYLKISIWYTIIFGPLIALVSYSQLGTFFANLFYPQFDIKKHEDFIHNFWSTHTEPTVDIMLPVAGESIETLKNTWEGIHAMYYQNKRVTVLDDSGSDEIQTLALQFGFHYLSRPNKGEHKKSGNIQYGIDNTNGEFIFILDADFRPIPEALNEIIPYIVSTPTISILQTPQYFDTSDAVHARSPIEYGAGSIVEEFYRIMMPSRVQFGSGKCVGTSAVYRRKAILEAGGMPKVSGSEDIRIGLATYQVGYHVHYIPLIISQGACPDNLQSYFKQQSRWADGTFATIFSGLYFKNKLDIWAKFNYLNSFMYYLVEAIAPLISLQMLALLYFNTESVRISWIIPFIPYLIYYYIIRPKMKLNPHKYGSKITGLTNMVAYADALVRLVFRNAQKWEAAGSTSGKKTINKEFFLASIATIGWSTCYTFLLAFVIYSRPYILVNWETWIVLGVALKRVFDFGQFSWVIQSFIRNQMKKDSKSTSTSSFQIVGLVGSYVMSIIAVIILVSSFGISLRTQTGFVEAQFTKLSSLVIQK